MRMRMPGKRIFDVIVNEVKMKILFDAMTQFDNYDGRFDSDILSPDEWMKLIYNVDISEEFELDKIEEIDYPTVIDEKMLSRGTLQLSKKYMTELVKDLQKLLKGQKVDNIEILPEPKVTKLKLGENE